MWYSSKFCFYFAIRMCQQIFKSLKLDKTTYSSFLDKVPNTFYSILFTSLCLFCKESGNSVMYRQNTFLNKFPLPSRQLLCPYLKGTLNIMWPTLFSIISCYFVPLKTFPELDHNNKHNNPSSL
jgi:hypothetical protein